MAVTGTYLNAILLIHNDKDVSILLYNKFEYI